MRHYTYRYCGLLRDLVGFVALLAVLTALWMWFDTLEILHNLRQLGATQ